MINIKKKIWVVAPFAGIEENNYRNRFPYLSKIMMENGYEVTLITSQFSHFQKKHINVDLQYPFKTILLYENGYKRNISLQRIKSHRRFSIELKKWLINNKETPDLIYIAYPTISAAEVASNYAQKLGIPIILDIQDTWPESISVAIDINKWKYKLLLSSLTKKANRIYKSADAIIGVSETYVNRAKLPNSKSKSFSCVYIGTDLDNFNNVKVNEDLQKAKDEIWITYIGTLSHSYDIETAILAVSKMDTPYNIKLNILGDGPDLQRLKYVAENENIIDKKVLFRGYLPYEEMVGFLKKSDVALNAIKGSSKATVTNKFGDYLAAGLPILNCCETPEIKKLIIEENLGVNYISGNVDSLLVSIRDLLADTEQMNIRSLNSLKLAEERVNRKQSYKKIVNVISNVLKDELI